MSKVVLIHGIAQQLRSADELETEWIPAIAGGVRIAGAPLLADELFKRTISIKMAFYGHRFRTQEQGDLDLMSFSSDETAQSLALEWLERAASSEREEVRVAAKRELSSLNMRGDQKQGIGNIARSAIGSMAHVPLLADLGMRFAQKFLVTALRQVTSYLANPKLRRSILDDVAQLVDTDTTVIIGHSLGSVIAFEAAHELRRPVKLLLTLGSPIGLRNIVFDKLRPAPPSFPALVHSWHNIADKEDFIAAASDLRPLFAATVGQMTFENTMISKGSRPHEVEPYLNCFAAGAAMIAAL